MKRTLNTTINCSKNEKNDEHYTQLADIQKEINAYLDNEHGEVTSATIVGNYETHEYDFIGNSIIASFNGATNTYTANNLNQYTSILRASAPPRETSYDLDGNMTRCGEWTYAYDSGNRLVSVSSNNAIVATFAYDARGRRVKKVAADGTHRYFYDGWLLAYEHVTRPDNTVGEIEYVWGKDLSGTRGGAAGIGGLLYLAVSSSSARQLYIPCYDNLGNVTRYLDENGNTVAQYTYDAFGNIVAQSGTMADAFAFRYSTKYFDSDCGLYYYGYRYYHPVLMRWLTEDPIGVEGGLNLYGFCGNNSLNLYDIDGRAVRIAQNGREITVTVNITIYYAHRLELNARTDLARIASRIKKQIEEKWNAQVWHYGCCTVKFKANVKYRNQVCKNGITDDNLIAISTDPKLRSEVYGVGGNTGYWNADNSPGTDWRFAHEAGHLMGLDDDYTDDPASGRSVPHRGHGGHMMGEFDGSVNQHEVEDLLRANNVRCN